MREFMLDFMGFHKMQKLCFRSIAFSEDLNKSLDTLVTHIFNPFIGYKIVTWCIMLLNWNRIHKNLESEYYIHGYTLI